MQGTTFGQGNTADQKIALDFINRNDVKILNWYRTQRSKQGKSEANLKVWAICDENGTPKTYLVGSANLTKTGLHHNIELMTLANDISDRHYLEQTLRDLQAEAWDAKDRLRELIENKQEPSREAHVGVARTSATSARSKTPSSPSVAKEASTGCGTHILAGAALVASLVLLLVFQRWHSRR